MSIMQTLIDYDLKMQYRIKELELEVTHLKKTLDTREEQLKSMTFHVESYCNLRDGNLMKHPIWDESDITRYGGKMQQRKAAYGDTFFTHDGVTYDYRSVWDDDEDADSFLRSFADGCITSDRDYIGGILTVFFTVRLTDRT